MKDSLGDRMKGNYESRSQTRLLRRTPVIIRADGKSFSKFCKRFEKPHDEKLHRMLNDVMKYLCENIQGAKFAERHSDEISILVTDYDNIETDAFFDYEVQKICSVVASWATAEFCKQLVASQIHVLEAVKLISGCPKEEWNPKTLRLDEPWPVFDCRCFNIPENEIENYFWWRMRDATRNSIGMLARSKFSHRQLVGKNQNEMQEMLFSEHGINWNDLPRGQKAGFVCRKEPAIINTDNGPVERLKWRINASPMQKTELDEMIAYALDVNRKD